MVQFPLSIFDQRVLHSRLTEQLKARGKKTVARSIFLQGLFFLETNHLPNHLARLKLPLEKLQKRCEHHGISIANAAISFVRDLPGVDYLVIGADSEKQVDQLVQFMKGPKIPNTLRHEFMHAFRDLEDDILSPGLWNTKKASPRSQQE